MLVDGGSDARYLPTGHLVFAQGTALLAVPFDIDRLDVTGSAIPLVEGVGRFMRNDTGVAHFDVSESGTTLVYLPGSAGGEQRTLTWVDRAGNEEPLKVPPGAYVYPRLSPDGTQVTLDRSDGEDDVWVMDLQGMVQRRLTFSAQADQYGIWTPDGQRVVFSSARDGFRNLYWRTADGTGEAEPLTESQNEQYPHTISPDGMWLVFREHDPVTGPDLYMLRLDDDRRVEPLVVTEFTEYNAEISPNGRWMAYQSNASGDFEIWVRPFPEVDSGSRRQVTTTGGMQPLWGPDGRELFYRAEEGVMGVPVETGASFDFGTPRLVVKGDYWRGFGSSRNTGRTYDVSDDGQRFLMIKAGTVADMTSSPPQIIAIQNFDEELKRLFPDQ